MALTKVAGDILDPGISIAGVVTATAFDGPFRGGSGSDVTAGVGTFTELDVNGNVDISGNLTVNGDYTTLNTTLREVELLRVDTNSTTTAGIITQTGAGDILNLFDATTEVLTVIDGGKVGIGTSSPGNNMVEIHHNGTTSPVTALTIGGKGISSGGGSGIFLKTSSNTSDNRYGTRIHTVRESATDNGASSLVISNEKSDATGLQERLRIKSDGKVGIGTDSPQSLLTVGIGHSTNAYGLVTHARFQGGGTYNGSDTSAIHLGEAVANQDDPAITLIRRSGSAAYNSHMAQIKLGYLGGPFGFKFATANAAQPGSHSLSTKMVIDQNGKVGIGSEIPAEKLDVYGTIQCLNELRSKSGNDLLLNAGSANRDVKIQVNDVNMLYVKGDTGNIGIGIAVPAQKLHVYGNSGNTALAVGDNSTTQPYMLLEANEPDNLCTVHCRTNNPLTFKVNNSEKLRITSAGNVGIGTDDPNHELTIFGDELNFRMTHTGSTGHKNSFYTKVDGTGVTFNSYQEVTTTRRPFIFTQYTDERMRITSGGNLKVPDGAKIELGGVQTGAGDLSIWHDSGGNSYIKETGGGALVINADDFYLQNVATTTFLRTHSTGEIDLNHSGDIKLATSSTGVTVTGKVVASGEIESAQDYPNYRPTIDFNFTAVKKLDPRFTYERTGPASYVDEFGIVKLVGANVPRFDHDPITRECKGLLIEESRTNIFASSDAGNSVWVVDNSMTKGANSTDTKDPAGTYTACKLMSVASAGSASQIYDQTSQSSGGVVSAWAKKGTHNVLGIYDFSGGVGSIRAWFDLNTGEHQCEGGTKVAAGLQSEGDDTNDTWMIEYPNGWYRCIYYESSNMTYAFFRICDFGSDTEASASSNSIYLWGLQGEVNVTFATSHIPCNTGSMPGTITRGSDKIMIENDEFYDFYNSTESTICASYTHLSTAAAIGTNPRAYRFRADGGADSRIDHVSHTTYHPYIAADGTAVAGGSGLDAGTPLYEGQVNKWAVKVKKDDFAACLNGGTVATDTSGTWPPSNDMDQLSLGSSNGAAATLLSGHYRRFTYYPVGLTNAQLVTLTS